MGGSQIEKNLFIILSGFFPFCGPPLGGLLPLKCAPFSRFVVTCMAMKEPRGHRTQPGEIVRTFIGLQGVGECPNSFCRVCLNGTLVLQLRTLFENVVDVAPFFKILFSFFVCAFCVSTEVDRALYF